jgi:hypothetical protein
MTLPQIRQECRERGARTTGRKADLVGRLEAHDRNDDFRGSVSIDVPTADPIPHWPDMALFKTVTPLDEDTMSKVNSESTQSKQEPLKPRTNVSCRFLENQLAISFLLFDISYR